MFFGDLFGSISRNPAETSNIQHTSDRSELHASPSASEQHTQEDEEQAAPASAHVQFEPLRLPLGGDVGNSNSSINRKINSSDATYTSPASPAAVAPLHPPSQPIQSSSAVLPAPSNSSSAAAAPHEDGMLALMFGGAYATSPLPPQGALFSAVGAEEKAEDSENRATRARRGLSL